MSPCPVRNTIGSDGPTSASRRCSASPSRPGRLTSSTRQPGADASCCARKSSADSKSDSLTAVFAQQPRQGLQHRSVVIDEEDRRRAGVRSHGDAGDRQLRTEHRSALRRVRSGQTATVRLGDGTADRQAHAHAAGLGAPERLEHFVQRLRRDARTAVGHAKADGAGAHGGADRQDAPGLGQVVHRIGGIDDQVQQQLLQLHAVARDRWQDRREMRRQGDMARQSACCA